MMTALGIPSAPTLMAISADFTIEMSLNRMSEGLQLYQDLLSTVRNRVSTPEKLDDLLADIRDLLSQVLQMRELAQLEAGAQYGGSGLAAQLAGEYEVKVATHLALTQLQSFSQDMFRSLRNISRAKLVARN
ncbi:hypothetical protein JZ751_013191 [Albula glossodonta]|uniref:Uncharacterized protein n=1 Tax=Albula glossodonta TaxID=121402 RepID=A0A8T2NWZ0_9TELE|nr:hypothetical protein JZ751_013191 [Albula glossodonta]